MKLKVGPLIEEDSFDLPRTGSRRRAIIERYDSRCLDRIPEQWRGQSEGAEISLPAFLRTAAETETRSIPESTGRRCTGSMNLDDIPGGSLCVIDTNVLLYAEQGVSFQAQRLLRRLETREVLGIDRPNPFGRN